MATPERGLVFVLGPGRSGTSTMAGALAYSGYTVPQAIRGNATNPSGFFEPRWAVNFHRKLLGRTGVRTLDTDPTVLQRIDQVTHDPAVRDELRTWLSERFENDSHLVIKDPRMVWFKDLWVATAQELEVDPRFVIMLRHPSEVSSSRSNYYNAREVSAVAGWINVALTSEQLTAGSPRALVHYPELTADWRSVLTRLRDQLDLRLDPAPEVNPHPVDEFIDPSLRRMKPGWENVSVPGHLADLGDRTFDALGRLAAEGDSEQVATDLDALRAEYAQVYADAEAMTHQARKRLQEETRRKTVKRTRTRAKARELAQAQAAAPTAPPGTLERVRNGVARRLGRRP